MGRGALGQFEQDLYCCQSNEMCVPISVRVNQETSMVLLTTGYSGTQVEHSLREVFMKAVNLIVFIVLAQVSFAQAGLFEWGRAQKTYSSYGECLSSMTSADKLIPRDALLAACGQYQKTAYDNCQAFLVSDGKWEQMFACRPDLKEGEVIVQQTGSVVDVCEYMNWDCKK